MREKSQRGRRTFALTADVAEAHRQVPIDPRDWHMLGCQVEPGGAVYVHTVGTFGVASASYYWSRVAGAIGRVTQYCSGSKADTWHVLVADDFHLEAGGPEYRRFTARISSGFLSDVQLGSSRGLAQQQNKRPPTWPNSRKVWKESCS